MDIYIQKKKKLRKKLVQWALLSGARKRTLSWITFVKRIQGGGRFNSALINIIPQFNFSIRCRRKPNFSEGNKKGLAIKQQICNNLFTHLPQWVSFTCRSCSFSLWRIKFYKKVLEEASISKEGLTQLL